ncbi:MAG: helix-turn-helix transcriptional regulator [Rhodoferax sp.]|nr:helix-turn-helix transcriptional regulator [Rhodoferax sp.]
MTATKITPVLENQLLLQLGDRLKRLRKAQRMGTVEMATRVGIARNTLRAIESGDPAPSMGSYLRVMSVLGVSGELALLVGDTLQPAPTGSAAAQSRHARPAVQVLVSTDSSQHEAQDLQSIALHRVAVDLVKTEPALLIKAQATLTRWLNSDNSRSTSLWKEWDDILRRRTWRKVLGRTRRAQELRQASPLITVLPDEVRKAVLDQISMLKRGVVLGDVQGETAP